MRSIPALRPLRHRDARLLFGALAVSLLGDGIWLIASAWQVIELGGGPVQLSLVAAATSLGLIGFVLVAGVVADRVARRPLMLFADLMRAAVVAATAALSIAGTIEIWHLVVAGFAVGAGTAFFIPAYTATLPQLLPEEDILAANGLEGAVRPLAQQALGPAIGGVIVAAIAPGAALLGAALGYLASVAALALVRASGFPERGDEEWEETTALADLREGARYVRATRWLWATLLFAIVAVLFAIGPIEVLTPFAVRDRAGGGASDYGLLLACFGVGAAIGALAISSRRMPRRYLTVMLLCWSVGTAPVALLGIADALWLMAAALVVVGVGEGIASAIWGTLLQRRVPDALRGRVSSLDWFVSLALLPVSMALAGPAADAFGITAVFLAAGLVPVIAAAVAYRAGRLGRDELAHPLA